MTKMNYIWKLLINAHPLLFWIIIIAYNSIFKIIGIIPSPGDPIVIISSIVALLKIIFPALIIPLIAIVINCILSNDIPKFFGLVGFSFFIQMAGVFIDTLIFFNVGVEINCFLTALAIFFFDIIGIAVYLATYFIKKSIESKK